MLQSLYSGFHSILCILFLNKLAKKILAKLKLVRSKCNYTSIRLIGSLVIFSLYTFFFVFEDSPGWDGGRTNGYVNGFHDNRTNGGFGGRGPPRNDRGGRGAYPGNRGGGSFNQPLQNTGGEILLSLKMSNCPRLTV